MPPKRVLRVSSYWHNAFNALDCQGLSGIAGEERPLLAGLSHSRAAAMGRLQSVKMHTTWPVSAITHFNSWNELRCLS